MTHRPSPSTWNRHRTASGASSEGVQVLLVDDDPIVREVLGRMLAHHGHKVRTAATGPAALKALAEARVEVLLSDVSMSPMNGFQLAIRVRERWPDTAIVLVTGWDQDSVEAEAPQVDHVLCKPATLESVGEAVIFALAARSGA